MFIQDFGVSRVQFRQVFGVLRVQLRQVSLYISFVFYYFTGSISVVRDPTPSPCQHAAFVSCFVLHSTLLYLALGVLKNRFIVDFFSTESVFGYDCV